MVVPPVCVAAQTKIGGRRYLQHRVHHPFYGQKVLPPDILVRASVHNEAADKLLAQVGAAARAASKM